MNWTYASIMLAAWATGFALLLLNRQPLGASRRDLAALALGAFCGGMIGAKLPFVLADWPGFLSGKAWFQDGKTIMSGLVGGYVGAIVTEWALGIQNFACDVLAAPWPRASAWAVWPAFVPAAATERRPRSPGASTLATAARGTPRSFTNRPSTSQPPPCWSICSGGSCFAGSWSASISWPTSSTASSPSSSGPSRESTSGSPATRWRRWCWPRSLPCGAVPRAAATLVALAERPRKYRSAAAGDHLLKPTRTLCPVCLKPAAGATYEREGKVYLRRTCPKHGTIDALVCSDRRHYYLRDEVPHPLPVKLPSPTGRGAGGEGSSSTREDVADSGAPVKHQLPVVGTQPSLTMARLPEGEGGCVAPIAPASGWSIPPTPATFIARSVSRGARRASTATWRRLSPTWNNSLPRGVRWTFSSSAAASPPSIRGCWKSSTSAASCKSAMS